MAVQGQSGRLPWARGLSDGGPWGERHAGTSFAFVVLLLSHLSFETKLVLGTLYGW